MSEYKKRLRILLKILYYKSIVYAIEKSNTKKGANLYAFEYLKRNLDKYVRVKDVQDYCNTRNKQETGQPLGDPSRSFELLRKNKLPLEWSEIHYGRTKFVKYTPHIKNKCSNEILQQNESKGNNFSKSIIEEKLKSSNFTCSITGIPQDNGGLAADHFIPKEKGGLSDYNNCIILNKILNEKKNKKLPIEWFCETLLTNFLQICKNVGIIKECKTKLIQFIEDF
jgi:hypothetical protein